MQHLQGTHAILAAWRQPSRVMLAGLLHSAYSTDAFEHAVFRTDERQVVQALIGDEAEHLAFLFCGTNRQGLFESIEMDGWDCVTVVVREPLGRTHSCPHTARCRRLARDAHGERRRPGL